METLTQHPFKPPRAATLMSLAIFMVLIGLGTWQVKRLEWKTALLASISTSMEKPSVPLPEALEKPEEWKFRRVTLAGQFLHDHAFLIGPRTLDGTNGYHMYVPFQRLSGGIVFVNRGWISDALMPKVARPQGTVKIEGIVQLPTKTSFTPDNVPTQNAWYWPEVDAMAHAAGLKGASPAVVTLAVREPGVYPVGGTVTVNIRNDHKQYAIFWFVMAFISQAIFVMRFWRRPA